MDALAERLRAGGFHRGQTVLDDGGQNLDHLSIAIIAAGELAPHALDRSRQHPVLERRAFRSARASRENWHIMPGIEDRRAAPEGPSMFGDHPPFLAEDDAVGVGVDLDPGVDGARIDREFIVVQAHEEVFDTDAVSPCNPSNRPRSGTSFGRSSSNASQTVLSAISGCG